jgi:glycosyltransferase involved in cell wall biosynthesis
MSITPEIAGQKRLLMVGNFLSQSFGTRSVCDDLQMNLQLRGWSIVTTSSRLSRPARLCDMLWTSWDRRDDYGIALIDVYSGSAFLWAEAVCALLQTLRKPHVLALHGGDLPSFARRWTGRVRMLLRSAAAVTTPSGYLLMEMDSYCQNLRLLPNPLDVNFCRFRERNYAMPHLLWLRKFHRLYNPALAPLAVAQLKDEFPEIQLTMSGPDKGDGALADVQRAVSDAGVAGHVRIHGAVPAREVPSELDKGDIFLNTTNIDNTPVSILEAMACGLCIVSTNVGGIPYLLEHERDALLVPPGDPIAMAGSIRRILVEPGLAHRLSLNARRKAETFDWSNILPQWEHLLSSIAAGRS